MLSPMRKLIREPLLHFLLLGAALFALYGWLNDGLPGAQQNEIVVSRGQMRSLEAQFVRVWQRPPTPQELQGLIDNWVREEILFREGLLMGLDRDDPVVRRRVAQKVEFILDSAIPTAPTEAELQGWLDTHSERYSIESQYSLRQVFFDPARHDGVAQSISGGQAALQKGRTVSGDPTMLPKTMTASASEVARIFGSEFEIALRTLPLGSWEGPVTSGFGIHLVELSARAADRKAGLSEVREAVTRDLMHARSEEANAAFYEKMKATYNVRIDDVPEQAPAG
jgi:hypothetical protein